MLIKHAKQFFMAALFALLLPIQCILSLAHAGDTPVTIETIYNVLQSREQRIRSCAFSWTEAITVSKGGLSAFTPAQYKSGAPQQPAEDKTSNGAYRLVLDGGKIRAEGNPLMETPTGGGLQDQTYILKEGLYKSYTPKGAAMDYPAGAISNGAQYKGAQGWQAAPHLMPLIMALRPFRYEGVLFDRFTTRYSIIPGQQVVRGRKCTVIKDVPERPNRSYNMLWLDNERDYMPVRFSLQRGDVTLLQIDYLRWDSVGSEWLPIEWKKTLMNSDGGVNRSALAVVNERSVNQPVDEKEFTLEFPVGTHVTDYMDPKNPQDYIVREEGRKREITKSELGVLTHEQLLNSEPSDHSLVRRRLWLQGLIALSVALGVAVAVLVYRVWRRRRGDSK